MKKKISKAMAIVMLCLAVGQHVQPAYLGDARGATTGAADTGKAGSVTGQTDYKPKAMSVEVGKKVSNSEISTGSVSAMESNSCVVSSKSAFMDKLYKYMNARKTSFTITFKGPYTKIYKGGGAEKFFAPIWSKDNKNTSNDFDYLYGNVNRYGFRIPQYSSKKSVFKFTITYREGATKLKKVNTKVKTVLNSLKLSGKTRARKVKDIHDYIVKNVKYDNTLTKFTAYDGLVSGSHSTVCQGYALLFYKMCTEAGIPCRFVYGTAKTNSPGQTVSHAWNIVKIGEKWYFVDPTWDDTDIASAPLNYDYFLIGSKQMYKDHTIDSAFKTAAFKKKYPIASGNCDWVTACVSRADYKKDVVSTVKSAFGYSTAGSVSKVDYDAYITVLQEIVDSASSSVFTKLVKGSTNKKNYLINISWSRWVKKVQEPVLEYLESDQFVDDREAYLLEHYSIEELNAMTDEEYQEAAQKAGLEVYKVKHAEVVSKEKETIKTEVLNLLKTM